MQRRAAVGSTAIGVVLTVLLAGCSTKTATSTTTTGTAVPGGNVVDYQNFAAGDPTHIDPALADDVQSSQIARLLFDGLTKTDDSGAVKNAVALSVTPNADATQWTFGVRSDVQYDDGEYVVPSDFKFAWTRVLDPSLESHIAGRFTLIKGADDVMAGKSKELTGVVADDSAKTITVSLTEPYRDFPALVSTTPFSPLPQKLFAGNAKLSSTFENGVMVGNGPFRMAGPWEHDKSIKLLRSDRYYGGYLGRKAYVDSVDFKMSKDLNGAYNSFETTQNSVGRVPAGQYDSARAKFASNVVSTPLLATEYWAFNLDDPAVGGDANLKLRQAIALAINKRDIVSKLYGGSRIVANAWAPPGLPGYQISTSSPDRNVEAAKDLLTQWGKTPPTIKISFNAGAGHDEKATIIQQNLADIGIHATIDPIDQTAYGKAVGQGKVQFFRGSWTADYVSYDDFIAPLFASPPLGDQNVYGYSNSNLDALVKKARAEPSADIRAKDYESAEKMMLADQVLIPLDWSSAGMVHSPGVEEFHVEPLGYVNYAEAWVQKS